MSEYVVQGEQGTLRVAGTRVSLASVVHAYWNGDSPEEIAQSFPSLSLEKVHGALAYYLAHRAVIDEELEQLNQQWDESRSAAREQNKALRDKLLRARATRGQLTWYACAFRRRLQPADRPRFAASNSEPGVPDGARTRPRWPVG